MTQSNNRLAILAGARTPFIKSFGKLADVSTAELGKLALEAVLDRARIKPDEIDEVVFGNVAGPADSSNVARVIALQAGVPEDRIAHTVNRNCASGMESIVSGWQALKDNRAQIVVAGGTESMSNIPLLWDERMKQLLLSTSRAKSLWKRIKAMSRFRPGFLKPTAALQLGLTDPVSGLNMGETAEILAQEFGITREEQDQFAMQSHHRAAAAQERCFMSGEVHAISAEMTGKAELDKDDGPRPKQSMEQLAKLRPIFQSKDGTVTAGNSCPLTDGAAATLLANPERAKDWDGEVLGFVSAYAIAGCDPRKMGLGPVFATAKLLKQTGLSLADFDLVEINEAFAAQVLACVKAMASDSFAQQELGLTKAVGEIDPEKLNVNGGAIALGHPVGTSGTRLAITLLRALREKGLRRGLATLCVGGGQGYALVVETE